MENTPTLRLRTEPVRQPNWCVVDVPGSFPLDASGCLVLTVFFGALSYSAPSAQNAVVNRRTFTTMAIVYFILALTALGPGPTRLINS